MSQENEHLGLLETSLNVLNADSRVEGTLTLRNLAQIQGRVKGKVVGLPGSVILLGESALVEGEVHAETLFVSGTVEGKIFATKTVTLTASGRILGDVVAPNLKVETGGLLDGAMKASPEHAPRA